MDLRPKPALAKKIFNFTYNSVSEQLLIEVSLKRLYFKLIYIIVRQLFTPPSWGETRLLAKPPRKVVLIGKARPPSHIENT